MRVVLTGATGTIGRAVAKELSNRGHGVVALSRDAQRAEARLGSDVEVHAWVKPAQDAPPTQALDRADGVIHLLGEPISQRWSEQAKRRIRSSRVDVTRQLVGALRALTDDARPKALISQSATGFYGSRNGAPLDEGAEPGDGWLAELVVDWEQAAAAAGDVMRVVTTRTGVVFSPEGGALAKMLPFFRLGIGGPVAGGRQYVPWIHLDDAAGAIVECLENDGVEGAVNLTSPNPVTNAELSGALGRALHRPASLPVPRLALKALYGEMAEIVTTGQRVLPARLLRLGYRFRQPELDPALRDVLTPT
jgi:uncharacterized protein (TIGR01777 family)